MGVTEGLTLERARQALDQVKAEFEVENGYLTIITEDLYEKSFELLEKFFIPDEPISRAIGYKWTNVLREVFRESLGQNLSLAMIAKDTNELMGVRILDVVKKSDPEEDFSNMQDELLKEIFTFLTHKYKEVDFFNRYGVDESIRFFALAVNEKYRRIGLGGRLLAAAVAMCKELGFKAIQGTGTSNFSQRIYEKLGFEQVVTMPYDTYCINGQPIGNNTGEHRMAKIYAKTFNSN